MGNNVEACEMLLRWYDSWSVLCGGAMNLEANNGSPMTITLRQRPAGHAVELAMASVYVGYKMTMAIAFCG